MTRRCEPSIPAGHAFAETRDTHPGDFKLRIHGYRIHARPKGKPALWEHGNCVEGLTIVTEQEALKAIDDGG